MIDPTITSDRHLSTRSIARYFDYDHLVPDSAMAAASGICCATAEEMIKRLPDGPELTAGLLVLLEARDCFVRAALDAKE